MGRVIAFQNGRRPDPPTPDDWRDEVTALRAETLELVAAARPVVAQLAVIGINQSPAVLSRARILVGLLDRAERRSFGGAA